LRAEPRWRAFIPLFAEPPVVARSVELLRSRLVPGAAVCLEAPVGGLAFVATGGEVSEMLDTWWSLSVPENAVPVLLMLHEPELEAWVPGLEAEVVVGVARDEELALYVGAANVTAVVTRDPLALTEHAMAMHAAAFGGSVAPLPTAGAGAETPYRPRGGRLQQTAVTAQRPAEPAYPSPPSEDRWQVSEPAPGGQAAGSPQRSGRLDFRSVLGRATNLLTTGMRRSWVPEELTRLALSHQSGKIVGVTSRAGGVGKTAIAAAVGIIYGEAVQDSGWCAAVVDQNIGNPDQWGRLSLATQVRTVFEIMSDIEAGREWTVPAWNRTPALAVYPERRDLGEGYAPGQVERFAGQLRQLHMMTVVDLPNRLPAFTSAEAAVCAGWVNVADMVLLPTTDDPTRLLGVLEYLDAPMIKGDAQAGFRPVRVVVPYVRSPLRAVRDDAGVRSLLDQIRSRVVAVVEIPKNERATLAIVKGQPITEIDASLRDAYIELALTVGRTLLAG
jgi:septum formation inhibitor-activating ATPase MinD